MFAKINAPKTAAKINAASAMPKGFVVAFFVSIYLLVGAIYEFFLSRYLLFASL
jgi:hypothetical protein